MENIRDIPVLFDMNLARIQRDIQMYVWYDSRSLPQEADDARSRAREALEYLARRLR